MKLKVIFLAITLAILVIIVGDFCLSNKPYISSQFMEKPNLIEESDGYKEKCLQLYTKILKPNKSLFFKPPLKKPPAYLMDDFTQNGQMPITKYWYFNEAYSDSKNDKKSVKRVISQAEMEMLRDRVRRNEPLNYGDRMLNELMREFHSILEKKSFTVIGTQLPWVEAIALEVGCSKIVTLDYTHSIYEMPQLEWYHVSDYLEGAVVKQKIEEFDNAASFSSLEHAGLGRYGDPLNPNGDIEAVQQIHCMLKPGGLLFLALPTSSNDDSSYLEFNAQRVYGKTRLDLLFKGWRLLMRKLDTSKIHTIFVLEKIISQ